jgi:hypothetical protein
VELFLDVLSEFSQTRNGSSEEHSGDMGGNKIQTFQGKQTPSQEVASRCCKEAASFAVSLETGHFACG